MRGKGTCCAFSADIRERLPPWRFDPSGRRIASAAANDIRIWDTKTGDTLLQLNVQGKRIWTLGFSPDGAHLAAVSPTGIASLYQAHTGDLVRVYGKSDEDVWFQPGGIVGVAFGPSGLILAEKVDAHSVRVLRAENGEVLATLRHTHRGGGDEDGFIGVTFSSDGSRVLSDSRDVRGRSVFLWDLSDGRKIATIKVPLWIVRPLWDLALSPDGETVALRHSGRLLAASRRVHDGRDLALGEGAEHPSGRRRSGVLARLQPRGSTYRFGFRRR